MLHLLRRSNDKTTPPSPADNSADSPPRIDAGGVSEKVSAGDLDDISQKKDLTHDEVMVVRQSMVQVRLLPNGGSGTYARESAQCGTTWGHSCRFGRRALLVPLFKFAAIASDG